MWPYRPRRFRLPAEPGPAPDLPAAAGTLLEVDGLSRTFGGVTAVDGFALRARRRAGGERDRPERRGEDDRVQLHYGDARAVGGTVVLGGRSVRGLAPHRVAAAGLARTFQSIRLFDEMTVAENVLIGRFARDRGLLRPLSRADLDTVRRCLDFTGLLDAADRPAGGLPYGDRRRWRSRGHSRATRGYCCWTSPRRARTRPRSGR